MHDRVLRAGALKIGYWFPVGPGRRRRVARAGRLDTNDHFVFEARNALSMPGHVYFRIRFIFIRVLGVPNGRPDPSFSPYETARSACDTYIFNRISLKKKDELKVKILRFADFLRVQIHSWNAKPAKRKIFI